MTTHELKLKTGELTEEEHSHFRSESNIPCKNDLTSHTKETNHVPCLDVEFCESSSIHIEKEPFSSCGEVDSLNSISSSKDVINGLKSSTLAPITNDYQTLVDKLHKLGNGTLGSVKNSSENQEETRTFLTNGIATAPPTSPSRSPGSGGAVKDVLVLVDENGINYVRYESERQMPVIMSLISKDLSEPYSIYTYRYFIHNWPGLCYLATEGSRTVGAIVCKLDHHKRTMRKRGYIAMLAVDDSCRRKRIGSTLVGIAIDSMIAEQADEVVLETEVTNLSALRLYEKLGFVRDKRLYKYYLNGVDAFRLKLWLT
ncbi:N-alpha-acetyltransferase 30-like isoform X1 [Watersipora subatra]|uniref:N-alpha-acetyltransferase 30-like isoform X1 n=2 Tax=Watersipora subatra TaxID=2589382 RepID=UPI00355BED19